MPPAHVSCVDDLSSVWALVSTAGVTAIIGSAVLLVDFRSTALRRLLAACAAFSALIAVILTWQQYRSLFQAQNIASLQAFGAEADQLLEEGLKAPDADSPSYRARADDFSGRLENWVALNIGPRALDIVRHHDPKDVNIGLENPTDYGRASSITQIAQTKEKIAALVDAKASDECVKPTTSEHPIARSLD
jgi:hypothetical protein